MKKIFVLIACLMIMSGCSTVEPAASNTAGDTDTTPTEIINEQASTTEPDDESDPVSENYLPIGFAVQRACQKNDPCLVDGESYPDGSELLLVPSNGGNAQEIYLPGLGDVVHIASPVDFEHPEETLYIFREFENNQLQMIGNNEVIRSFDGSNCRLVGALAQQVFALSYLPGSTDSGMAEIAVHPGMGAMVTAPGPEWLLTPVLVIGNQQPPPDNEYVAMWYTYEPYGIGGEIVFPPYSGLYYLYGNGEVLEEILSQDLQFSALSPDGQFAAFTQSPFGELNLRDLSDGKDDVVIPLLTGSDKGAGSAVFSPDSLKVAWTEASGSLFDGNFSPTIRIATVDGDLLAEFSAETLQQASGYSNVIIRPVGWIDSQRILLQVHVTRDYGDKILLVANIDGTIADTVITGTFVGLVFRQ